MKNVNRRSLAALMAGLLMGSVIAGGAALAAVGSSDATYTACVDKRGVVKIIDAAETCARDTTTITLVGPAGHVASADSATEADTVDGQHAAAFAATDHGHPFVANMDLIQGVPCQVGTAQEGAIDLAYGADGVVSLTCVEDTSDSGLVEGQAWADTVIYTGTPGSDVKNQVAVADNTGAYSFYLPEGNHYLFFESYSSEWYENRCDQGTPEASGATVVTVVSQTTTTLNFVNPLDSCAS